MLPSRFMMSGLAVALGLAVPASAQIGDRADKSGEVQKSLVPADQIPAAPVLTPEQAMKTFKIAPGYRLELAAAEPQVQEPVAITFSPDGRMWVAEMRGYMPDLDGNGEDLPTGRISVLRDADGDGRFEESKVFIDKLVMPRTVAVVGDGLLVGAPPELAFYRDTDGDGVADKKEVVATDYGVKVDPKRPHLANPERAPNSLTWAYDNWIYSAAYTRKFRYNNGTWEMGNTSFRGQYGMAQDAFGRLYHGSNSDGLRIDLVHSDYLQRNRNYPRLAGTNVNAAENQFVWPSRVNPGINRGYRPEMLRNGRLKEFTAACGWWVYRGDAAPEMDGNVFVAEPAGNFVRRWVLDDEAGVVKGTNPYKDAQSEFLTSTDERFRPVAFGTGPDGALYVVDLYRGVLQHRISLTSYLRKQSEDRSLDKGLHLGRIYRVVPEGKTLAKAPAAPKTTAEWVERLTHTNEFWRENAQRVLVERRDASVLPALRKVATSDVHPAGAAHALWALDGMGAGALDKATVLAALGSKDTALRTHAIRLSEKFFEDKDAAEIIAKVRSLLKDKEAEVQLQAVLSLGNLTDVEGEVALAETARANPKNTYLRDALFSGVQGRELALLEKLAADPQWSANDNDANAILLGLARGVFGARDLAGVEKIVALAGKALATGGEKRAFALLDGLAPGVGSSRRPLQLAHAPEGWAELEKQAAAEARAQNSPTEARKKKGTAEAREKGAAVVAQDRVGGVTARIARLKDVIVWPGKPGVAALADVKPLTAEQQARFESGKQLYNMVCAACHQANGRGLDGLAPPLLDSEWILGSHERPVRIVLHGVRGPITVLGRVHTGDMPAFGGALDDTQISSILTYLRREWGHTAAPVDPDVVKAIRAKTAGHSDAWSPEELNLIK